MALPVFSFLDLGNVSVNDFSMLVVLDDVGVCLETRNFTSEKFQCLMVIWSFGRLIGCLGDVLYI